MKQNAIKTTKCKHTTIEWGIILSMMGVPIGRAVCELLGNESFDFSNLFMLLGLLLIFDYGALIKLKSVTFDKLFIIIFFYQVYILILAFFSGVGFFQDNFGLVYTIYIMALILAFATNNRVLDSKKLVEKIWFISGLCNIIMLYIVTNHFTNFVNITFIYLPAGTDRLTVSRLIMIYVVSFFVYRPKKNYLVNVLRYVFLISSFLNLLATNRRSYMVVIACIVLFHIYKNVNNTIKKLDKKIAKNILIILFLLLFIIIFSNSLSSLLPLFSSYIESVKKALLTFFGGNDYGNDASAYTRVVLREQYLNIFINNYSITEILFGRGYMSVWIDLPIFQIFLDTGILGGLFYTLLNGYIYIQIYSVRDNSVFSTFMKYYAFIPLSAMFIGGFPYGYTVYIPVVLMIFSLRLNKKTNKEKQL